MTIKPHVLALCRQNCKARASPERAEKLERAQNLRWWRRNLGISPHSALLRQGVIPT